MRENLSYIFFKELTGPGPWAHSMSQSRPVIGRRRPHVRAAGSAGFPDLDRTEASGLWVAQDTGGAIKGANRFDTFWGAGDEAEANGRRHVRQGPGPDFAAQG